MSNERKILYLSAGINFTIGIVIGIILFFGQIRNEAFASHNIYEFDRNVSVTDFVRMSWVNLIWMFSIVAARSMLSAKVIHPVLVIRGCVNAFSLLYILHSFGIKEAVFATLPQSFSVLPMLIIFSAETVARRTDGNGVLSIGKGGAVAVLLFSVVSAGIEVLLFRFFCAYLF
ncbi:MAG: hypothetical protein E7406_02775 [Ruminococcaceae bacterium]|nr:hypothetical protein [Oscillospiraceae bacterium]